MKNYTPIAMRCNKEQFEAIKPKLIKAGYVISAISDFKDDKYLVNDFNWEKQISNISFDSNKRVKNHYKWIEQWDEKIFLEACGIETEPTYQITKETILKYNMKDEFPDVFEVKLEVGKWYKRTHGKALFKVLSSPDEDGKFEVSGFDVRGFWMEGEKCYTFLCGEIEATHQEVETALKNEAVRRYKVGDYVSSLYNNEIFLLDFKNTRLNSDIAALGNGNCLWMNTGLVNSIVFDNGVWAKIIPTKTKKEAEELLNCKIV